MSPRTLIPIGLVIWLAGTAGAARQPGEPFRQGINFFTREQDVQLGREVAQEVRKKYPVYRNAFVQDYVRRVGDRLASTPAARESGFAFTFTVMDGKQVNAFALPGGPMFVLTGLLKNVDNEAQLAAAMAHEMSHVILRHGTHEVSKANMVRLPAVLAAEVLGNRSILTTLTNMGANSFILKFSRDAESEADALGSHLMAEAGYDPMEMARLFNKLRYVGEQGDSRLAQFLSDHPNPGNRERAIEAEVETMPPGRYGGESGDFGRMKASVGSFASARR